MKFIAAIFLKNILKIISLIGILTASLLVSNMKPVNDSDRFITKFEDRGNFCYVVESGSDYTVRHFDKKPVEKSEVYGTKKVDIIEYQRTSDWIILYSVIIFFGSIFVFIASLPIDDDFGWKIRDTIDEVKLSLVKCEFEDDVYYYHYNGKLLIKSKTNNISHNAILNELEFINLHPKYEGTKSQQREKKLKNILG